MVLWWKKGWRKALYKLQKMNEWTFILLPFSVELNIIYSLSVFLYKGLFHFEHTFVLIHLISLSVLKLLVESM